MPTHASVNRPRCPGLPVAVGPLLALALLTALAAGAPARRPVSPYAFNVTLALHQESVKWLQPCGPNVQTSHQERPPEIAPADRYEAMADRISDALQELTNWRELPGRKKDTVWNSHERKIKFKFLQPFVRNESSWERRLSIYWASLKLVRMFHDNHSDSATLVPGEADALQSVNFATKELLCSVQEYREAPKRRKKQIDAEHMERIINFSIKDAGEIEIDIWYIMCRLECFLNNMRQHLQQLQANGGRRYRKFNMMRCASCPYCGQRNKQCKLAKKKKKNQQKQQQHQQHQQQQQQQHNQPQRQRNRPASNQPKPTKQQPSRQPKQGRKGTRTPNSHARNNHG